jgi:RNA polymerase sigma-70 factor (ECF subfamily)
MYKKEHYSLSETIQFIYNQFHFFRAVVRRSLPNQYWDLSEDFAQDAMLKAIDKIDSFNSQKGNIKSWLYRVIQNHCFDELRKLNRTQIVSINDYAYDLNEPEIESKEVEFAFIRKAMMHLESRDRRILIYKFMQGMTGKEISHIMGIPENQINMYIKRAKERLKFIFLKEG